MALRNINLIVQKYPEMLTGEIKVFFCKYNDPIYVKQEKLETMVKLSSERNIDQVLLEFKEYATEVDVDFVRKSVRAIGRCAISSSSGRRALHHLLLELIQHQGELRRAGGHRGDQGHLPQVPEPYESIIAVLCETRWTRSTSPRRRRR